MTANGNLRNFKPLEMFTVEQTEAIHRATLEVLETSGVRFESEKALQLFKKHDCKVDFEERRVRFPPGVVEECLRKAPSSFRMTARNRENDVHIGGNTLYFSPSPGMRSIDLDTWEQKVPTIQENHDAVKVLDALPHVHLAPSYTPYCELEGVPPVMLLPVSCWSRMKYFTKPSRIGAASESHIWEIQMAQALNIDVFAAFEAAPPLTWYGDAIDCAWACAENGYPVEVGCGCVMGGTGPATIAGALVQSNAEIMSGIVMVQLIRPGNGILSNSFVFAQNMRTGSPAAGGIEVSLFQAGFNQLWRGRYNIPTMLGACGPSSSQLINVQMGYEKGISSTLAAISGASVVNLHGGMHVELTYHPVQSVLDDDIAGMLGRFVEGVAVNHETLAADVIQKVGPIPGHYLTQKHTREWWKKEHFTPLAADRLSYPEWIQNGKKSALENARQKVDEILASHEVLPALTSSQEQDLDRILEDAREYYRGKGTL
jgi:trimethylamine---corrinoid protein Co-methyltransferase